MYQVGFLVGFSDEDPEFGSMEEAIAHAEGLEESVLETERRQVGIWSGQEEGSELLMICHEGEWFRRGP